MHETDSNRPSTERRRSERVSRPVYMIVRGTDLLGQPFEERTSTIALNLHGCRYSSKHHLPRNSWITLDVPEEGRRRDVRARVAWIQRPHSVREFFQVAVELESPANLWHIDSPPGDWQKYETGTAENVELPPPHNEMPPEQSEGSADLPLNVAFTGGGAAEQVGENALEKLSALMDAKQQQFLSQVQSELELAFSRARSVLDEINRQTVIFHHEVAAASESTNRFAEVRLQAETSEVTRNHEILAAQSKEHAGLSEDCRCQLAHKRLESEMALAQIQWNELLQSSLDGCVERVAGQLTRRSEDMLRTMEREYGIERLAELREPLEQMSSPGPRDSIEFEVHA